MEFLSGTEQFQPAAPPARWALGPPPAGAAHPPSSPATVAAPRRVPPPCWLLFAFPESVASDPSANQGSRLRAGPANGIPARRLQPRRACVGPAPHGSCSSVMRPRAAPPPRAGNFRQRSRNSLEARSWEGKQRESKRDAQSRSCRQTEWTSRQSGETPWARELTYVTVSTSEAWRGRGPGGSFRGCKVRASPTCIPDLCEPR